ncbi:MAG: bifunctional nuclease family protein [Bacteroides sp.]|nr:bifunctional nuclease family protein [Bacteroides sp.]
MEKRYRLKLIGITYNQIESGVYALILQQMGGQTRIPIVIGFPEAQAIQCKLQEVDIPRPLTHDTMVTALSSFGVRLKEVEIKRLQNGVFAADLYLIDSDNNLKIVDARSSDAVALAIRVDAPIYTTEKVLLEAGMLPESDNKDADEDTGENFSMSSGIESLTSMSIDQLHSAMTKAAENENYEEAAKIKAEINRRTENQKENEE